MKNCDVFSQRKNPEELYQQGNAFCKAGDNFQAAECYRQGAQMGHAPSQNEYGRFLQTGTGAPKDPPRRFTGFERRQSRDMRLLRQIWGLCSFLGQERSKTTPKAYTG